MGYSRIGYVVFKNRVMAKIEQRLSDFSKYMNEKEATDLEGCNPRTPRQWLAEFQRWSDIELEKENERENERLKQRSGGSS